MLFLFLSQFLFNIVISTTFTEIPHSGFKISHKEYSIEQYTIESLNFISYFDCFNNQYELCIWNSSLIYDVHFYNNKVISYSLNKTLFINNETLFDGYDKFILKDYLIHSIYISILSFILCIWFIFFHYNRIKFPLGTIILSINCIIYYIQPKGIIHLLFDPFSRFFLLSLTTKDCFYEKGKEISLFFKVASHYINEIAVNLNYLSLLIAFDLLFSIGGQIYLMVKKTILYKDLIRDGFPDIAYPLRRKYIFNIIYHITLSLLLFISFIWVVHDKFSSNYSEERRNIYCLYFYFIYMVIIAVFYFPTFKLEMTIEDIIIGLKNMVLLKMKREYIVRKVNQTNFGLTDKERIELENANKKNIHNIIVVYNPMNNISIGTIQL